MKYRKIDIFKLVVLGLCIAVELFYFLAMVLGSVFGRSFELLDFFIIIHSLIMMYVSIGGCVSIKKGKRAVLIPGCLLKLVLTWVFVGFLSLAVSGLDVYSIFPIVSGLVLLALGIVIYKYLTGSEFKLLPRKKSSSVWEIEKFESDKAKWAWDSAAEEYCWIFDKNLDGFTDEDNGKIYSYAGSRIAYFLAWLIKNNFVSPEFMSEHDAESIDDIKNEKANPVEFFGDEMDFVLRVEDLSEEILPFVNSYYFNRFNKKIYSHVYKDYFFDYYEALQSENKAFYCVDFSWEIYHRLEKLIDKRYKYYAIDYEECRETKRTVTWNLANVVIRIEVAEGVTEDYVERCINHLNNLSECVIDDLCDKFIEMMEERTDEKVENKRDILKQIYLSIMIIYTPQGDEPAFSIRGECDFEEEHGFSFELRGDAVFSVKYNMDYSSPWNYENDLAYRIAMSVRNMDLEAINTKERAEKEVKIGRLKGVSLTPDCFNGEKSDIYLPPIVADLKVECDKMTECLLVQGMVDRYECEPKYKGESIIPCRLWIRATKNDKTIYSDCIKIW